VRTKHIVVAFAVLLGVAGLIGLFLAMRAGFERAEQRERSQSYTTPPQDLELAKSLRTRATEIRGKREALATAAKLAPVKPDPARACEHRVPALDLHPLFDPSTRGLSLFEVTGGKVEVQSEVMVPIVPVAAEGVRLADRSAGLAERMEEVAKQIELPFPDPAQRPAREDARALLAAPSFEVLYLVHSYVQPKIMIDYTSGSGSVPTGFTMGSVSGRAILVDLATGTLLCAADVSASNSDSVGFSYDVNRFGSVDVPTGAPRVDAMLAATDDLWEQAARAVGAATLHALARTKTSAR
jgi:hypothetical protein